MSKRRKRGRPPLEFPPRIEASPEEIAQAALQVQAPRPWNYMQGTKDQPSSDDSDDDGTM